MAILPEIGVVANRKRYFIHQLFLFYVNAMKYACSNVPLHTFLYGFCTFNIRLQHFT
jgi:hypothetical protein